MREEILPNLFRIEIPLPNNPLKYLNSYVIKGGERNLIIDTGLNREECFAAMQQGLREIGVELATTDFFITHLHADHFGLVARLVTDTSTVHFNRPDAEIIESQSGWEPMVRYAGASGFPEDELRAALENHPGYKYKSEWVPDLHILKEGDRVAAGQYTFTCVETPGHTRGHICLYEPAKKVLVAGDHILIDITPNIQCWSDQENPLQNYLDSLNKIGAYDIELVLPGHRRLFTDARGRIDELKRHHDHRAQEVLTILEKGPMTAYQVASKMTWDIDCETWEQFPVSQKWFATGEAISHLRYLEEKKSLHRIGGQGHIRFSRNGTAS